MSNFLGLAQAILTTVVFTEGITTAVLKKQIETIVKKYQPEFDCINNLYAHVEKLAISRHLISQLRTSMTFSADQWAAITSDLNDRKDFFDTLKTKMEKINMPSQENKWSDYTTLFFQGLGAVGLWNLYFKETNIAELTQKLGKWCKKNRVQPIQRQASISQSPSNDAQVEVQLQNVNAIPNQVQNSLEQARSPDQIAQNSSEKPTTVCGKAWDGITLGIHFVVIVGLCIGLVAGAIDIAELAKEKKKLDQAFGANGDFQKVQEGVIQLMKFVSISLYQISTTSKYVLNDLSRLFLTKSVLTPKYFDLLYGLAIKLTPLEFGVTDAYITASGDFMTKVLQKGSSKQSNPDKLYGIQKLYDNFMTTSKPDEIMGNIAEVVSQAIGKFSLASGDIENYNAKDYRFLYQVCNVMAERNINIAKETTDDGRKTTDTKYLKVVIDDFNKIYKDETIDLSTLNTQAKNMLYHTIGLFCTDFYYDDTTGKTIFTLDFTNIANLKTYGDIFKDYEENPPKYIKISYTDANLETAAQNVYVAQVKKLSNDNNSTVHPLYRYVTYVSVDNPDEKDEQKKKYVKSIEGMKYTLNNDAVTIKSIERDFENQTYYLVVA